MKNRFTITDLRRDTIINEIKKGDTFKFENKVFKSISRKPYINKNNPNDVRIELVLEDVTNVKKSKCRNFQMHSFPLNTKVESVISI